MERKRLPESIYQLGVAVLSNGKPYDRAWHSEGTLESGPLSGQVHGYRWGQVKMEVTQNGSVHLYRDKGCDDGSGVGIFVSIYSSSFPYSMNTVEGKVLAAILKQKLGFSMVLWKCTLY